MFFSKKTLDFRDLSRLGLRKWELSTANWWLSTAWSHWQPLFPSHCASKYCDGHFCNVIKDTVPFKSRWKRSFSVVLTFLRNPDYPILPHPTFAACKVFHETRQKPCLLVGESTWDSINMRKVEKHIVEFLMTNTTTGLGRASLRVREMKAEHFCSFREIQRVILKTVLPAVLPVTPATGGLDGEKLKVDDLSDGQVLCALIIAVGLSARLNLQFSVCQMTLDAFRCLCHSPSPSFAILLLSFAIGPAWSPSMSPGSTRDFAKGADWCHLLCHGFRHFRAVVFTFSQFTVSERFRIGWISIISHTADDGCSWSSADVMSWTNSYSMRTLPHKWNDIDFDFERSKFGVAVCGCEVDAPDAFQANPVPLGRISQFLKACGTLGVKQVSGDPPFCLDLFGSIFWSCDIL